VDVTEGYSQQMPKQCEDLKNLVKNATKILEIGFNAGHSSEIFLTNSVANIVSFDLGEHHYVIDGKQFIDLKFPKRHTLILGDSHNTIPSFKKMSNIQFDFLFIDGDHSYEGALQDLLDCQALAEPNAVVVFDDVVQNPHYDRSWTTGPKKAWKDMISMGKIEQLGCFDYDVGRGMVYGKYK
jgi:predicted O-methyltransferase YrrM